jgi:hypothetical protein
LPRQNERAIFAEKAARSKNNAMHARFPMIALVAVLFAACAAFCQTPQLLQTKFDQEPDALRRSKMMMQLSRADFQSVSEQVAAGDNTDALKTLQQLVDDAQHCSDALDAKESNPEAHPAGFKQLQIATRESLRRLDDLTVGLVGDEQVPFLAIRKNLDQLNRHLIRELFPHQPLPREAPSTPASQSDPEVKP